MNIPVDPLGHPRVSQNSKAVGEGVFIALRDFPIEVQTVPRVFTTHTRFILYRVCVPRAASCGFAFWPA